MKRMTLLLAVLMLSGCKKEPCVEVINVGGIQVSRNTAEAMRFCQNVGKTFRGYAFYDYSAIDRGYQHNVTCEDK